MKQTNISEQKKSWRAQKRFGGNWPRTLPRVCGPGQNRLKKVFHSGPSCLCSGA